MQLEDPGGRRRGFVIVGAIVAVLAIVGTVLYFTGALDRRGGEEANIADVDPATDDAAKHAVEAYVAAIGAGDCDTMYDLIKVPDEMPGQMNEDQVRDRVCSELKDARAAGAVAGDIETEVVKQTGNEATVKVTEGSESVDFALEKVGGEWKIDIFGSADGEPPDVTVGPDDN